MCGTRPSNCRRKSRPTHSRDTHRSRQPPPSAPAERHRPARRPQNPLGVAPQSGSGSIPPGRTLRRRRSGAESAQAPTAHASGGGVCADAHGPRSPAHPPVPVQPAAGEGRQAKTAGPRAAGSGQNLYALAGKSCLLLADVTDFLSSDTSRLGCAVSGSRVSRPAGTSE